ncbi:MAG: carbon-nitrogen hydrolase family protein [Spirochaetota bacterium]
MRIGVSQIYLFDSIEKNKERIIDYINIAKKKDVNILCFPETALSGYIFEGFLTLNYYELEGALKVISDVASQTKVIVVLGTPLKQNGVLYNSAVILYPDGKMLKYHKNNLVSHEELYFKPGKDSVIFDVEGFRFGVMVCRDQNFPELACNLKGLGAHGIFICSAHYYSLVEAKMKKEKNNALPIARAYENKLYVFKSNAVGTLKGRISYGNSMIVNPDGIVVLRASETGEEMLVYDI